VGHLIARACAATFETLLRRHVLDPLGMASVTTRADEAILQPVGLPHVRRGDQETLAETFAYPRARVPSGGLIGSVEDLLRFAAFHLGSPLAGSTPVLDDDARLALQQPHAACDARGMSQALGWRVVAGADGEALIYHDGSYTGYQALLLLVPAAGVAIAVLTNSDSGAAVCRRVREVMSDRLLGIRQVEPPFVALPPERLLALAGRYEHNGTDRSTIRSESGGLVVHTVEDGEEQPPQLCMPVGDSQFIVVSDRRAGWRLTFLPDTAGEPAIMRYGARLGARVDR
jgi:CubicO group peptidase (beta-lactamase class C family)